MVHQFQNLIVGSLSILAAIYTKKYEEIDKSKTFPESPENYLLPDVKEYDFIIGEIPYWQDLKWKSWIELFLKIRTVGGGSAGGTLANRLSQEFTVLLIEAGGDPIPQTYVPVNYFYTLEDPTVMHIWETQPQRHSSLDDGGVWTTNLLGYS